MARYPRLREETERIITTYIRYIHQKCSYFAPSRQKRTRQDPKILDYVTLPGLWGLLSLRCTKAKIIYLTLSGRRSRSARSRSWCTSTASWLTWTPTMRTSSASPSESFILLGVGVFLCPFISAPFFGLTHSLLDMMIWRVQGNFCCGELSTNFHFDCSSFKQLTCVTSKTSNNLLQAIELISFLAFSQPLNKMILWCVEISVHRQQPKMLRRLDEN